MVKHGIHLPHSCKVQAAFLLRQPLNKGANSDAACVFADMKAVYCTKIVGLINRMSEFRRFIASETGLLSDLRKLWNTVVIPQQQAALKH